MTWKSTDIFEYRRLEFLACQDNHQPSADDASSWIISRGNEEEKNSGKRWNFSFMSI